MNVFKKIINVNVSLTRKLDMRFPHFSGDVSYEQQLLTLIERHTENRHCVVLEAGGTTRPMLKRSDRMTLDGLDIEPVPDAAKWYDHFFVQSIEEPLLGPYDLIVSKHLLEHVRDNQASFLQMNAALRTGGCMIHYLPSKYHPYSIALRLVGHRWQKRLIPIFRPWAKAVTGYPAFFHKCSARAMRRLATAIGFTEIQILPFYDASDYFRFFFPFYFLVALWENLCKVLKWETFCSGFIILALKH